METRALLTDQIERLWGRGELALVARNYAPDCVDHMPVPGQPAGLGGLADVVAAFRTAMPDLAMTLGGTIVDGERGCDWWTLTGTHTGPLFGRAPTGARVTFGGIDMIRVRDGQIAELWHVEEMWRFEAQLDGRADDPPVDDATLRAAAPDFRREIDARLTEGESTATRWIATGTHTGAPLLGHPARGRPLRFHGMEVASARSGRVLRVEELAQLRVQLG